MTIIVRSLLIAFSILTCISVIRRIRKSRMQIDDAVFWVIFSGMLIMLAIFPQIMYILSHITGIQSPANLIFLMIIFVLILKSFSMSVKISILESKIIKLVQEMALKEKESQKEKEK